MVSAKERKRMTEYVVDKLEDSEIYVARDVSKDCLQLKTNGEKNAYLFLHTNTDETEDFIHQMHKLVSAGDFVSNIFYKDGKNFFVLLANAKKHTLRRKSMKEYNLNEISHMVRLREKEQEVLRLQDPKRLVYYQPDNTATGGRLFEGLVSFAFDNVNPDYSHIDIRDRRCDFIMANNGKPLSTRFISRDKTYLYDKVRLTPYRNSPHLPILENAPSWVSTPKENAPNKALKYFLAQTGTTIEGWSEGEVEELTDPQR